MSTTRRTAGAAAVALAGFGLARRARSAQDAADLSGRTAVVTGAGSGIGRSLARLLAERGATVHLADRDAPAVEAVARAVTDAGGTAVPHVVDVADPEAVARLADAAFAAGPVDLLFNNAGIGHAGAVTDTTLQDWHHLLDVNVMGVVHGLHAFLPRLLAQQRPAHIVNTASVAGLVPVPGLVPYSTTKAAVVGLSDALDIELRGTGVRVSALCPGVIDTAIVGTATMRGDYAKRQARSVERYAKLGTSPDVVARQTLDAIGRGRTVIPSPRYQVVPHWLLKRAAPRAAWAVSIAVSRVLTRE